MTVDQAIDCVDKYWNGTCPVGQRQAAVALANEVVWLRQQLGAIGAIVNCGTQTAATLSEHTVEHDRT